MPRVLAAAGCSPAAVPLQLVRRRLVDQQRSPARSLPSGSSAGVATECGWRTRPGRAAAAAGRSGSARAASACWPRFAPVALDVRQHHRADRGDDQQRRGELEGEQILGEQQLGDAVDVAAVGVRRRRGSAIGWPLRSARSSPTATSSAKPIPSSVAATRWPRSVSTSESRRVPPDQHQHEQEQDHDRAGVDDDLHQAEERRLLDEVERRRGTPSSATSEQRRVHGVAGEHHAERAGERDRPEDPEQRPPRRARSRPRPARSSPGSTSPRVGARADAVRVGVDRRSAWAVCRGRHRRLRAVRRRVRGRAARSGPARRRSSPSRRRRAASGAAAPPCPAAAAPSAAPWCRSAPAGCRRASSYSLLIVSERVGQASMHRPQKMQRR